MNEIANATMQTPIEIALGIDENGMTTARKLFDFLGMSPNNYSRWFKNNLTNNQFAEENIDYFPFLTKEECGGQAAQIQSLQLQASQAAQNATLMAAMDANTAQIIRRTGNDCPIPAYVVQPPAQVTFPTNCCGQFNGGGWNNGCGQCGNC